MRSYRRRDLLQQLKALITLALCAAVLLTSGCNLVHKSVQTEKLLSPLVDATTPELVAAVNKLVSARSIRGKVDIQFEDTSFATSGIAEKYRTAGGSITLQRPGSIYLVIEAPVVAADIAQMTSDGEHFRIAILKGDDRYKKFVKGTNNAVYAKLEMDGKDQPVNDKKGKQSSDVAAVNALSNLRPQHLTDALLLRSISTVGSNLIYVQSEFFESEKDPAKVDTNKRVVRGYYFLDELQPAGDNSARLLRRFWFDRVGSIRLARLQSFDEKGALVNDVTYGDLVKFGADGTVIMPARISLTRPQDHYKISITYQAPESAIIDKDYPGEAFVLANKWDLPEVDLDAKKNSAPKN
jgi:hypothetical protein